MAMTVRDCAAPNPPAAPVAGPVRLFVADSAAAPIGNRCPEDYTGSRLRAAARLSGNPAFVVTVIALAIVVPIVLAVRFVRRMRPGVGRATPSRACAPSVDHGPTMIGGVCPVADPVGTRLGQ